MNLEIVFNDQVWAFRRTLAELSLPKVVFQARKHFKTLPEQYGLNYTDVEGDSIDVICEDDFNSFKEQNSQSNGLVKLVVNPAGYPLVIDWAQVEADRCQLLKEKRAEKKQKNLDFIRETVKSLIPELTQEIKKSLQKSEPIVQKSECPFVQKAQCPFVRKADSPTVHGNVRCDGCNAFPMVGIRYKCSVCEDFDYCETCESKIDHPHAFLKIKTPAQAPKFILTAMEAPSDMPSGRHFKNYQHCGEGRRIRGGQGKCRRFMQDLIQDLGLEVPHLQTPVEKVEDIKVQAVQEDVTTQAASQVSEVELVGLSELEDKIILLCALLNVAPHQIRQTVIDLEGLSVADLVDLMIDSPQLAELRQQNPE